MVRRIFVLLALMLATSAQGPTPGPIVHTALGDLRGVAGWSLNPANPDSRPPGYGGGTGHTAELQYLCAYQSASGPLSAKQRDDGARFVTSNAVEADHHCAFW